ncbi:hypothetical protein [Streptomyces sp. NPDC048606]|uniref:hypothetical protein n=1 Tax=Streptomyces sp. NPDC048606 TaxID=3154726 RepID=UPI00342A4146
MIPDGPGEGDQGPGHDSAGRAGAGPTHNGSGTQNNHFHTAPPRQRPDRLSVAHERRSSLRRRFVRPPGFGEAARRIAEPGAVVLIHGAPGIGRHAAATVLLHEAADPDDDRPGRFEELPPEPPEDTLDAGPRDRFLLNLSAVASAEYVEAQLNTLAPYRSAVEDAGARMAVVLPAAPDHLLDPQFEALAVRLERPDGEGLVRRFLRREGVPFKDEDLGVEALTRLFASGSMGELARFCETVVRARKGGRHGTVFRTWAAEALGAVTQRATEAADQIKAVRSAEGRALLLSAAMLHGAPADVVFDGRNRLLGALGHRPEDEGTEAARFVRDDLHDELTRLVITRDPDGAVTFDRLEYDTAIRRHFWLHFPDLRPAFGTWVEDVLEQGEPSDADKALLVRRFVERVLDTSGPADLLARVPRWTDSDAPHIPYAAASTALERALDDERHVRVVLDRMLNWSQSPSLSAGLHRVLTDVCRGPLSESHPYHAVVRLHHLAHRPTGASAREVLFALVERDPRLRRYLHRRIVKHAGPRSPGDLSLLLDLYAETSMPPDLPWWELPDVWRAAMDHSPRQAWAPLAHRWLDAALKIPEERRARALDVLVEAVEGSDRHGNQLYTVTCHWAGSRPERAATAARLRHGIDVAQGLVRDETVTSNESRGVR